MTWKEAVQKVAKAEPHQMLTVAGGLVVKIATPDKEQALVRALMREAHMVERVEVRAKELAAVRTTPGRTKAEVSQISNELKKRIGPVLEDWRKELRLEWRAELLASSFTLRNGASVTWGDATVAEHRERVDIFMGQVAAGVDGAARHNAAIRAIEAAGVSCLNEAIEVAA